MNIPDDLREGLRKKLWATADEIGWRNLSPSAKSKYYSQWTRDPAIGGVLARFMDRGRVRVYLKDSLLKDYGRERLADASRVMRVLHVSEMDPAMEAYNKPHGRRLTDGRIFAWGRADDWKSVLMALHERAFNSEGVVPFAAVFLGATGRFSEQPFRAMVEDAAGKLNIKQVVWLET